MLKLKKQLIWLVVVVNVLVVSSIAVKADQQGQSGRGGRIARALNLTDDQKAQLKPLLSAARQQFQAIRNDATLSPDERRQKIQALRTQTRAQVDQILTPAQQQELDALRAKWRQQRGEQQQAPQQQQPQQQQSGQ